MTNNAVSDLPSRRVAWANSIGQIGVALLMWSQLAFIVSWYTAFANGRPLPKVYLGASYFWLSLFLVGSGSVLIACVTSFILKPRWSLWFWFLLTPALTFIEAARYLNATKG